MNQPELYAHTNKHAEGVNEFILKKYGNQLTWQEGESIMDVGAGLGNTTKHLLLPLIPENFTELVCSDISDVMLDFARTHFQHPKVKYRQLDITTEDLPSELENKFNHVFSFFCFHWIQNPKQGLKNVYKMLKPGGEMFISFLERNPFDQPYENLSKYEKWQKYGHENFITPYHHSIDSFEAWKEVVQESGFFEDAVFWLDNTDIQYSSEKEFKALWTSVNPIYNNIPEEDKEEYQRDHMAELKKPHDNFIRVIGTEEPLYQTNMKMLTIFAKKSG